MSNTKYGFIMIAVGFLWGTSGNANASVTCFCTALILFSIKE